MSKTDRDHTRTAWRTSLTYVEPNRILLRGYPLDEVMGRVSFAEAVYLLLVGELPSKAIGRLMEALLVSLIDHGTAPPSTQAARSVASSGAPLRAGIAAGLLGVGAYHGGEIEQCMTMLDEGVSWVRQGMSIGAAGEQVVARHPGDPSQIPGFGHRVHTQDPRAARLFQMALELEVDGAHLQMIRAVERALNHAPAVAPRSRIADQRRRRDRCGLRRHRPVGHDRPRAVPHLARAGHRGPGDRRTPARASDAADQRQRRGV